MLLPSFNFRIISRNLKAIALLFLVAFLLLFHPQPSSLRSTRAYGAASLRVLSDHTATIFPLSCPNDIDYNDYSPVAFRCRIQTARSQAYTLLNTQSTTPGQAIAEYKRHYGRDPPAGFSDWVQFALGHDSKVIDDFDQIDRDLEPYRTPQAKEVFRQLNEQEEDWTNTRRVTFVDGFMNITMQYGYAYNGH
jgi:hypothetical protein